MGLSAERWASIGAALALAVLAGLYFQKLIREMFSGLGP